jgi:hypothetical protein
MTSARAPSSRDAEGNGDIGSVVVRQKVGPGVAVYHYPGVIDQICQSLIAETEMAVDDQWRMSLVSLQEKMAELPRTPSPSL